MSEPNAGMIADAINETVTAIMHEARDVVECEPQRLDALSTSLGALTHLYLIARSDGHAEPTPPPEVNP